MIGPHHSRTHPQHTHLPNMVALKSSIALFVLGAALHSAAAEARDVLEIGQ